MQEVSGFGVVHKRYGTNMAARLDIDSGMNNLQRKVITRYPSPGKTVDKTPRGKKFIPNSRKSLPPRREASDSLKGAYYRDARKAADAGTVKPKYGREALTNRNAQGRYAWGDLSRNPRLR